MQKLPLEQGDCIVYIDRVAHSVPEVNTASWVKLRFAVPSLSAGASDTPTNNNNWYTWFALIDCGGRMTVLSSFSFKFFEFQPKVSCFHRCSWKHAQLRWTVNKRAFEYSILLMSKRNLGNSSFFQPASKEEPRVATHAHFEPRWLGRNRFEKMTSTVPDSSLWNRHNLWPQGFWI